MAIARIITDLSFGDAGKGTIVDFLARQEKTTTIIRFNGGPQAAHNVVTPDGRHHTFAQFGSGSFVPGVMTHLSEDMLINPFNMYPEAEHLISLGVQDIWKRITIDARAKIITPWHVAVNRLRECARGKGRHGSCAQGVGETIADSIARPDLVLCANDLRYDKLPLQLEAIRRYKLEQALVELGPADETDDWKSLQDISLANSIAIQYWNWADMVRIVNAGYLEYLADTCDQLLFEGAQGVLLDEDYGFHPYTTWSHTTPENARRQLEEIRFKGSIEVLGLVRAYTTRHGPGPFVTEDSMLVDALREYHNDNGEWQGSFRYGHFDAVAHRYAIAASKGIDKLVVTGIDRAEQLPNWKIANNYEQTTNVSAPFFFCSNKMAHDIVVGPRGDLDYQQELGERLFKAKPVYTEYLNPKRADIIASIQDALGVPINIASYGVTANDKQFV